MRRRGMQIVGAIMTLSVMFTPGGTQAAEQNHAMYIAGISKIVNSCEYVWQNVGGNPVRDELGIPKPTQLPPVCRTNAQGHTIPCAISRNLGPYPPSWRSPDLTQAEVGLNPPCYGNLSASLEPGLQGCIDPVTGAEACSLNAPTWYYGYCGQTYGGAAGGDFKFGGKTWTIDRLGFVRGRGAWEFGGKLSNGADHLKLRMYLAAVPDQTTQAAGCDVTHDVGSVLFTGVAIVGDVLPVKLFRPKPGWHYCTDDPIIGATGDGC